MRRACLEIAFSCWPELFGKIFMICCCPVGRSEKFGFSLHRLGLAKQFGTKLNVFKSNEKSVGSTLKSHLWNVKMWNSWEMWFFFVYWFLWSVFQLNEIDACKRMNWMHDRKVWASDVFGCVRINIYENRNSHWKYTVDKKTVRSDRTKMITRPKKHLRTPP